MSDKELIAKAKKLVDEAKADGMSSVAYSVLKRLVDALEAATSERAAVPDAATERVTENSVRHVKRLTTELQNKREALNDQRREYRALLSKRDRTIDGLRAERDAALAVIERVRKYADERSVYAKTKNNTVGSWRIASDLYDLLNVSWDEQAALDGAPEPEETKWEYGLLNSQAPDGGKLQDGAHLVSDSREHILTQQRRGHPAIQAVRRRKAGPWLPVEGEKP